jgi:hypothetical protein
LFGTTRHTLPTHVREVASSEDRELDLAIDAPSKGKH